MKRLIALFGAAALGVVGVAYAAGFGSVSAAPLQVATINQLTCTGSAHVSWAWNGAKDELDWAWVKLGDQADCVGDRVYVSMFKADNTFIGTVSKKVSGTYDDQTWGYKLDLGSPAPDGLGGYNVKASDVDHIIVAVDQGY